MPLPERSYSQVCYAVNDLEASALSWTRATGAGPWYVFELITEEKMYRGAPGRDRQMAAIGFLGATSIEFFQPLDDEPSIVREILDVRGEGLHHVMPRIEALSAASFDERCERYSELGLEAAMTAVVSGIGRVAFYDALDSIGSFIEVLELGHAYPALEVMADSHLGWDGSDPLRGLEDAIASSG